MYSITKMLHQEIKLSGWARQYFETFEITRTNVIQDRVTAAQRYNGARYSEAQEKRGCPLIRACSLIRSNTVC